MSPLTLATTNRLMVLEQGLESTNKRMEKYDLILSGMQRSQDRHDLLLQSFSDEIKALRTRDIDLSTLIAQHDKIIEKVESRWHKTIVVAKWLGGLLISIGLIFLGAYLSNHLF